jgi:hypothetical protein
VSFLPDPLHVISKPGSAAWQAAGVENSTPKKEPKEGFDVKVLREILRLRKQDKDERDEQESLLDLYLRAMESAGSSQTKAA